MHTYHDKRSSNFRLIMKGSNWDVVPLWGRWNRGSGHRGTK